MRRGEVQDSREGVVEQAGARPKRTFQSCTLESEGALKGAAAKFPVSARLPPFWPNREVAGGGARCPGPRAGPEGAGPACSSLSAAERSRRRRQLPRGGPLNPSLM